MSAKKRSVKQEKLARIYDDEILPVWSQRFGKMLLRDLELPEKCQVLDVACGTGYPAVEIVRRLGNGRLIAIESSSAMLDVARKKMEEMGAKGVFFRTESAAPRLGFAADVYDLVVCNLGLAEMPSPAHAVADFARVAVPGGEVRCTIPLEGTFQEFHDIYREVLTKHDRHDTLERLEAYVADTYPTAAQLEEWARSGGLRDFRVEVERFTMLFRSSREFFFAPVIEYGPLAKWKELAGSGQEMQDVFWYIKEAIDAYYDGRAFAVTVNAGCLIGRKREDAAAAIAEALTAPLPPRVDPSAIELGTDDIDIAELSARGSAPSSPSAEAAPGDDGDFDIDEEDEALDAFSEDKERPEHLDED